MPSGFYKRKSLQERLFSRLDVSSGCWEWMGAINSKGYGVIGNGYKLIYVHRYSYELQNGKITNNLQIDHLCRNTICCNPTHLELVTNRVNTLRRMKTNCVRGHNLSITQKARGDGIGRRCVSCDKANNEKRKSKVSDNEFLTATNL